MHKEVSAQEVAYRILSVPMKQLSRQVVFLNVNSPQKYVAVLKSNKLLSTLDDSDENVFQKSIIERYQRRPYCLSQMCLAQFGATYAIFYENNECGNVLPQVDMATTVGRIVLLNNFGFMMKLTREAITSLNKHYNSEDRYRAKIMLYVPWRHKQEDLIAHYQSFEEYFIDKEDVIVTVNCNTQNQSIMM